MSVEGGQQLVSKRKEALRRAMDVYAKTNDWVTLFRTMMGVNGTINGLFPDDDELNAFQQSQEFREILQMIARLRQNRHRKKDKNTNREPTKVITVRMPKSLHELLSDQADQRNISINQLCISKLLQMVDVELDP